MTAQNLVASEALEASEAPIIGRKRAQLFIVNPAADPVDLNDFISVIGEAMDEMMG